MSTRRSLVPVLALSLGLLGCGGASSPKSAAEFVSASVDGAHEQPPEIAQKNAAGGANPAVAVPNAPQPPMIVYTATLDVVVKDLELAMTEVGKLIAGHKGLVTKSEVRGDPGSPRAATYTLRVPSVSFEPLKAGLLALGHAERNSVETQDVTEEFIDVEARIKNLKEQETKLNELLKEKRREEKLEDVIKVSDRIYLVRGDIERAQGRRNYLLNRVQLSTIHLTLREVKDYKPPTTPTFRSRVGETFDNSWEAVVKFSEGMALTTVALTPWTPLWLPCLLLSVWVIRRLVRASQTTRHAGQDASHQSSRHPRQVANPAAPPEPLPPEEPGS